MLFPVVFSLPAELPVLGNFLYLCTWRDRDCGGGPEGRSKMVFVKHSVLLPRHSYFSFFGVKKTTECVDRFEEYSVVDHTPCSGY